MNPPRGSVFKLRLGLLVLTCTLVGVVVPSTFNYASTRRFLRERALERAMVSGEAFSRTVSDLVSAGNETELRFLLAVLPDTDTMLTHALVVDTQGQVRFAADYQTEGQKIADFEGEAADPYAVWSTSQDGSSLLQIVAPVFKGEELWGALLMDYTLASVEAHSVLGGWVACATGLAVSILGFYVASRIANGFGAPISRLVEVVKAVGNGNLAVRTGLAPKNEMRQLSIALDHMIGQLGMHSSKSSEYIASLEEQLVVRTKALEAATSELEADKQTEV